MRFVWHTQVKTTSTCQSALESASVHYCNVCFRGRGCFRFACTSANTITGRCHLSLAGHGNLSRHCKKMFPGIVFVGSSPHGDISIFLKSLFLQKARTVGSGFLSKMCSMAGVGNVFLVLWTALSGYAYAISSSMISLY